MECRTYHRSNGACCPDQQASGIRDREREQDAFGIFSWIHTLGPDTLLTISPFYHFNRAAFEGGPFEVPSPTDNRASSYAGGQASVSVTRSRHNFRAGMYAFTQHDNTDWAWPFVLIGVGIAFLLERVYAQRSVS